MSNILVVEDRSDWRDILTTTLAQNGHTFQAVASYQASLKALRTHSFNLAVVDPVLDTTNRFNRDGLSVVQKIREIQPKMPVIILTGSLTHDMEISLQHLYPDAPVLFKESWNSGEFNHVVNQMIGQQLQKTVGQAGEAGPRVSARSLPTLPSVEKAVGNPRVLLVENRKDWQEIVTTILDAEGYFWRIARNAPEALAELEQEGFHLVILDLKLQSTNLPLRSNEGWLLLDYLVDKRPKTKVLILSGKAGPGDVAHLLTHYPVIGFIEKQTFTPQTIIEAVVQAAQSPELRVQTFGSFRIWRNGEAVGIWERHQAETLVKLLLVRRARGGRAIAADEMITRFWPDTDEESGRKKLLPLISSARHTLEPDIEPRDSNFILRSSNGYYFALGESVSWDLLEFQNYLKEGSTLIEQERWAEAIIALEQGRVLYRGDFLAEDRATDWIIDIRREITGEFCNLLVKLADAYAALGRYDKAVEACEMVLGKDPLLERVYRRLMRFHYCSGEKDLALKTYRNCLKLFEELFGESPTPATRQLYQSIVDGQIIDCPPKAKA